MATTIIIIPNIFILGVISIVNNTTVNPTADTRVLWHLEGQRYMLQQIKNRIRRGKEWLKK